jgi:aminoglycoside phosphotransferase (APT) family kinase protein
VSRVEIDGVVSDEDARLAAWIEQRFHGRVICLTRIPRWRPAWNIDVEVGERLIPLHARGEREPNIIMPYRIADEIVTMELLEAHGLPIPHAFGLCDDPCALVMDRLPGHVELSFAADEAERQRLIDEYLELLARIYTIPVTSAAAAGFDVPANSAATGLGYILRSLRADRPSLPSEDDGWPAGVIPGTA